MANRFLTFAAAMLIATLSQAGNHTKYVNMFMGTAGDHGQMSPAAQVPYGLASVCPDCVVKDRHAGYDYDVPLIHGISVTRTNGVGGNGNGGNLRVRPAMPEIPLEIVKGSETAVPGLYTALLNNGVKVRLTASGNVAVEEYSFNGAQPMLHVDFNSAIDPRRSDCGFKVLDNQTISGWVQSSTTCNFGAYKLYFRLRCNKAWDSLESADRCSVLHFPEGTDRVELRIALSPVSEEDAKARYEEMECTGLDRIAGRANEEWERLLSRVEVQGSTEEQRILLYTSLYRVFLTPMEACATDGSYMGTDGKKYSAEDWTYYSGWSMWDTYRTKFPLITLLDPERMGDICRSLESLYCTGKENWATMHECTPTVRTEHSQLLMLDAWRKGIRGFDFSRAFPAMVDEYEHRLTRRSPDQKMETIYDIWALGEIAGIIGKDDYAEKFSAEAVEMFDKTWPVEFMEITDRFTLMKNNGMYQGTRWQYRWALPIFSQRMAELVGAEKLNSQLDEFFRKDLFNQGNEPDIHTPFMFNQFGHPEMTDKLVHRLLTDDRMVHRYGGNAEYPEPFVGRAFRNTLDGYAPEMDEDDGAMSAWYIFCQLGLYPLCVGTDSYELFTPLFKKAVLRLGGKKITIERKGGEGAAHSVKIDGKTLNGRSISHAELLNAKKIVWY